MIEEQQIDICKEILKKFIYKIRVSDIHQIIFLYYSDKENEEDDVTFPIYDTEDPKYLENFDFNRTKRQIKKRILTNRNNYWHLDETKCKIIEDICINNSKKFDENFKEYIENLWKCSLKGQSEEFEKEKQKFREKENDKLKLILKDKYDLYGNVISLILNDVSVYPYKSDKIKVLLELELDTDTIFSLLQTKEKWISPRGYINKYFEERKEGIKQKKIVVYELNSIIEEIKNQLRKL